MSSKANKVYNKWTDYQDTILQEVVERCGRASWNNISKQMSKFYDITKRTGKQCRQRWLSQLNASNNRNQWTPQDDKKLFEVQKKFGTKWNKIAKCFPGRTDSFIKNRFYSKVRKCLRKLCKFVKVKTTKINVYELKPCTLTHIFKRGHVQQDHKNDIDQQGIVSVDDYREILRIIFLFLQRNQMPCSQELQIQKVQWVIQKIMFIHNLRQEQAKSGQEEGEKGFSNSERVLQEQYSSDFYYQCGRVQHDRKLEKQNAKKFSQKQVIKQERKTTEMMYEQQIIERQQSKEIMIKQQVNIKTEPIHFFGEQNGSYQTNKHIKCEQTNKVKEQMIKTQPNQTQYIHDSNKIAQMTNQSGVLEVKQNEFVEMTPKIEQQHIYYRGMTPELFWSTFFLAQRCKKEDY